MNKFSVHDGLVAPMDRRNVDTDAIIPKQFLKSIHRTGFGVNLFDAWRYLDTGEPGRDNSSRPLNKEFVLNLPRYQGASIMLAGRNFGCGSSREHAPWALQEFGFQVIIAPSFGEIFFNNCYKNGLLPVVLDEAIVERLFAAIEATPGYRLTIDLENQLVKTPTGESFGFDITPHRKYCLSNGLDDIGLSLQKADQIKAFEQKRRAQHPYLFNEA